MHSMVQVCAVRSIRSKSRYEPGGVASGCEQGSINMEIALQWGVNGSNNRVLATDVPCMKKNGMYQWRSHAAFLGMAI